LALRAGDWIEVRSKEEILATLDRHGRLDGQVFMPEMFQFCGKRYRVWKRAHKTCDTVNLTGGRRLQSTVHLQELRCDGTAHGGCEAACLLFWKEAWLKRVSDSRRENEGGSAGSASGDCTEHQVMAATRATDAGGENTQPVYRCQATLLPEASSRLHWWDFRQYFEDLVSGNASIGQIGAGAIYVAYHWLVNSSRRLSVRFSHALIALYDRFQTLRGGSPYPRRQGTIERGAQTPERTLELQPGELVRVRSLPEILDTLDPRNRNRGMLFDAEEMPFCGKTFRVRSRVRRIIDETSGRMLELKGRNVILDGAWCQARYSDRRMFCPRAIYPFWRETWLERVDGPDREAAYRTTDEKIPDGDDDK
jgi:hypothetical protein